MRVCGLQLAVLEAECEHLRGLAGKATPTARSTAQPLHQQLLLPADGVDRDGLRLTTDSERALHFSKMVRQLELQLDQVWVAWWLSSLRPFAFR